MLSVEDGNDISKERYCLSGIDRKTITPEIVRKTLVFWRFQGVYKWSTGLKWTMILHEGGLDGACKFSFG